MDNAPCYGYGMNTDTARIGWLGSEYDSAVSRMLAIEARLNLTLPHSRKAAVRGAQRRSLRAAWLKSIDRVGRSREALAVAIFDGLSV